MQSSKNMPKTATSLIICRGCLATDARLYDMRQNRLMEAYTRLVNTKEDLPHYLCSYCAALLLKCDTFRMKCIDALFIMQNAKLDNGQLSMQDIKHMTLQTNIFTLPYIRAKTQTLKINEIGNDFTYMVRNNPNIIYEQHFDDSDFSMSEDEDNVDNDIQGVLDNDKFDVVNDKDKSDNVESMEGVDIVNFKDEKADNGQSIKGDASQNNESNDTQVLDNNDNIKPDFIINNGGTDHDYALNESVNKHVREVVEKYLEKTGNSHMLNNFQVNLYCNQSTLSKINDNKKMNLKIIERVDSKEMNYKLHKLLRGKNVNTDGQLIRTIKKQYISKSDAKTEIAMTKISSNGRYITIDFEDPKESDVTDKTMHVDKENLKCIKIKTLLDKRESDVEMEKFAKEYNMDVTFLYTKEEQIQSIEDRKNSSNYIHGIYKCEYCYKGFLSSQTYDKHMLIHSKARGEHVCEICHHHFGKRHQLNSHIKLHRYKFTCKDCEFTTSYTHVAKDHHLWHTGDKFACKHCGREFNGRSSHYAHLKIVHPTSDELVRCEMCGDSFYGAAGIRQHENMAHRRMYSPECLCSGCDTQFYCSDAFKAHRGTDGLCDTLHKYCVRCGMSFETEELLKEHEIEQRKPRNEFECEVCKKKFSNYLYYKAHSARHVERSVRQQFNKYRRKYQHRYQVPAMCELCGTVLKCKSLLTLHRQRKHTNERPHQCTYCPKKFKTAIVLKVHTRIHTGERPFKCGLCPKAFSCTANLDRHKNTHTGERKHMCTICGKTFTTSTCVKTHIKSVHCNIPTKPRIRRRKKTESL